MNAPHFASLLEAAPTEVDRPKPLPAGTYTCVVGTPTYDKSTKKQTPYVEFPLRVVAAHEDVDETELAEATGGDLSKKQLRVTFYLTEDAVYRLDEFHTHCGLDLTDAASRRQRNENCINQEVVAVVKHTASDDGTNVYANVARTAPAE